MLQNCSVKNMDPIVLSYHNSLLRRSDVALVEGPHWLNDKIIGFYFEYLECEVFKEYTDNVCFITPDVTQFIKLYEGTELGMFLEPLDLHKKDVVILAVNDNSSSDSIGGSHWSTLVYLRPSNTVHHYDSCGHMNLSSAKLCARRLIPFLKCTTNPIFQDHLDCPQQQNSYDCGIYSLCYAEAVCQEQFQSKTSSMSLKTITVELITQFRTKMKTLIADLAKEYHT